MMKIYSYTLPQYLGGTIYYTDRFKRFLTVQNQEGYSNCWAMIDENEDNKTVMFMCCPTGEQWDEVSEMEYLGTVKDNNGYVWHYFY